MAPQPAGADAWLPSTLSWSDSSTVQVNWHRTRRNEEEKLRPGVNFALMGGSAVVLFIQRFQLLSQQAHSEREHIHSIPRGEMK